MTIAEIDELALWALEEAGGAVRGPMRAALKARDENLTEPELVAIVNRGFALNARRPEEPIPTPPVPVREEAPAPPVERRVVASVRKAAPVANAPRKGRLSREAREALRQDIRRLLTEKGDVGQTAAYREIDPDISLPAFRDHYRHVLAEWGNRPPAVAEPAPEPPPVEPPPCEEPVEAPAPEQESVRNELFALLEAGFVDPQEDVETPEERCTAAATEVATPRLDCRSDVGEFTAVPAGDDMFEVRLRVRVDLHGMLQTATTALEVLYLTEPR